MKWDCRDMVESRARESWMYKRKGGRQSPSLPASGESSSIGLGHVPSPADGLYSFSLTGHEQPLPPALPGEPPVHPLGLLTGLGVQPQLISDGGVGRRHWGAACCCCLAGSWGFRCFLLAREKMGRRVLQA